MSEHKKKLREQLGQIDLRTNYATSWLPENYATQRIHAFGKNEFTALIESSIEYRKNEIIRRLNTFDEEVEYALDQLGIEKDTLIEKFNEQMDTDFGEHLHSTAIRMNPILANEVRLFGSESYSAILSVISGGQNSADLQRYAGALAIGDVPLFSSNRVCTFLIDLKPEGLQDPIAQFNHTLPDKGLYGD